MRLLKVSLYLFETGVYITYNSSINKSSSLLIIMSKTQNSSSKKAQLHLNTQKNESDYTKALATTKTQTPISPNNVYFFEQSTFSGGNLSTMHHSNTMGQEPSHIAITMAEPKKTGDFQDLENQLSPQQHRKPHRIDCKECKKSGISVTKPSIGAGSWIICLLFLMTGCVFFAWMPLCLEECQDVKHFCPNCGAPAGRSKYLLDA